MQSGTIRSSPRPRCFLCKSEGQVFYEEVVDPFFGASGKWLVKQCLNSRCGMVWLDPSPLPEDLHLAYHAYFTHSTKDGRSDPPLREILYRCYRVIMALPAALTGLFTEQRRLASMFLDGVKTGKLLDVGCGNGHFLHRMKSCGWMPYGVDFDPAAIESARIEFGLELLQGDLASARFPSDTFDAVTLNHVIEHVPDPLELLAEVRRVATSGARIVITTPNTMSLGHRRFGRHWFGLDAPRHLQLFNPTNLAETARKAGLRVIQARSTAARADIFLGASESIQRATKHQSSHQPAPSLLRTLNAVRGHYSEYFRLRANPDLGEEALVIARKS